jgi:hypothetical protein
VPILVQWHLPLREELKLNGFEGPRSFDDPYRIEGSGSKLDVLMTQAAIPESEGILFRAAERNRDPRARRQPPFFDCRSDPKQ